MKNILSVHIFTVRPLKPKTNTLPIGMKSKIKHHRLDGALKSDKNVNRKITHAEIYSVGKYWIIVVSVINNFFYF